MPMPVALLTLPAMSPTGFSVPSLFKAYSFFRLTGKFENDTGHQSAQSLEAGFFDFVQDFLILFRGVVVGDFCNLQIGSQSTVFILFS